MTTTRLHGRRILITGAASGIGRATAQRLAAEGARIAALDLDSDAVQALASSIGATALHVDVTDEASVGDAVRRAAQALGGLDGVVNSAGITDLHPVAEMPFAAWQRVLSVNLNGTFLVCKAALPWLMQADAATIVNIASASALQPFAGGAAYAASKAGVLNLTRVLAKEHAPKIRANTVCPGLVDTPLVDALERGGPVDARVSLATESLYALRRKAMPSEIAAAILFLTSGESSFVTGSTMVVDGGRTFY